MAQRIKIQLGKGVGGERKLTTYLKLDEHTTNEDVQRCVEWQALMMGVGGGVALIRQEFRPVPHRVYYLRGATAHVTTEEV
ncbi:hypothetical protein ANANSI_90 [Arthrobacter phage Anansi]|uniref:Uncharacterized protein n=3 Tax=Amigovirus amigo TaxID=1982100 RepID=A0A0U4IP01_9CAUD|nr:hypothetical protein ANANSI_1 [Arthrobacter phage Anansi]ALY09065.1 hypothetical protein GORGEOUS_1 [Arthrobacter phage Gorgeous]ALY10346.1 hypothetical protein SORJUANA_1 [Arthrobacter phage SorJuana]ALY08533.1 hypothetical protein ANANSI_90 [Arthrobacter phage Anansi]ALY09147.1 hypothetical protein GORGEOUS_90 [Arthrobacter phage Gorgeous]